jgi:hypothetical protein
MSTPTTLNLHGVQDVTPPEAPTRTPLSEKERAGVNLTWGVLGLITLFLLLVIIFLWRREATLNPIPSPIRGAAALDTIRFKLVSGERVAFREFWLRMVQMVLVNVLLPVLTALLGYVFGTQVSRRGTEV